MVALIAGMLMPVVSALNVAISPSSANIIYGSSNSIQFNAIVSGGSGTYTYQWYVNGNLITNPTSNTFTYTPPSAGSFSVNVLVTDNGNSQLQQVATNPPIQYYANNASGFIESNSPITLTGNAIYGIQQVKNNDGTITANVFSDNAPFEVSSDIAVYYGPLDELHNFTVNLSNFQYSGNAVAALNIWFDNNTVDDTSNGNPFFAWSGNTLTSLGGDAYALCSSGSCSGRNSTLSFTGNTMFFLMNGYNGAYSFNTLQLSNGGVATIPPNTMATVAIVLDIPHGTTSSANAIIGIPQVSLAPPQTATANVQLTVNPSQVANVTYKVKNSEDARWSTGYWALDNYTESVAIWEVSPGNYIANVIQNNGTWCTFKGALSPNWGAPEPEAGCGQYYARYSAELNDAQFNTSANVITNGMLNSGTAFDYGGTENAVLTGNSIGFDGPTAFDWVSYYFPGYSNFQYINNGGGSLSNPIWKYTSSTAPSYSNTLVETLSGATGDIITGPLVNATMKVINDEDSGNVGYWALDNYTKSITAWQTDPNSYFANVIYNGTWCTFKGALSPGKGIVEPANGCGIMNGGYTATFNANTFNSLATTTGSIGTFNFGGTENDILLGSYSSNQIGSPNAFDWVTYYFPGYTNFEQPTWSWTYTYNAPVKNEQWINANTGTSGDILTGFTINPYANAFLWFGYNTYSSNVPFGTWSNCPYSPGNTIVTVFCNTTALSNANWDVNTQSYLTSSTKTFTYNGTTLVEHFGSLNTPPPLISNTITFTNSGNGVWTANPANNRLITYNSVTSTPYGFILWGGNLTFSGMPSQVNFTKGTLYEWSYINTGNYLNNTATYPDAVYVPSENAYLALTSVVSLSANVLTGPQIKSLVSNTPYLGPYPGTTAFLLTTYDNDFLWISANEYFAPAAPFGHWSATPAGCYNQPVPGTGICANANNGYANLGGSEDLNALTLSGNVLSTSIAETAQNNSITFMRNGNNWIMLPNKLSLTVNSLPVSEYWRGTLSFNGMPSQANFTSGLLAQWDYVNASSTNTIVTSAFPDAVYDQAMKAWLISFNVYNLENKCYPSGCPIPSSYFSMPFPNDFSQLSGTAEPLPYSTPVMLALNGTPVTLVTNATEHTFILSTYDNDFIWFGFSEFGTNAPYGIWSNCPNVSSSTNNACLGITATGSNAFGNSNWDLNAQSFGTGSDFTPFVVEGNTLVTQMAASPYQPMKMSGYLHFNRVGSTNTWTANPLQPNNMELTYPTTNNTSAAFGYILVGGNLTFNGMPSAANFTSGVIKEWAYNYNNTVGNTLGLGTFPDVITVPSQSNALLALTSLSYMSGAPLTVNAISNLIANAGYLGPAPGASAVLSGHTANVAVTIPSNTPVSVNYTSAGAVLSIKSTGSNTITAKVFIANLTASTSTTPSVASTAFTKLLILNLSVNSTGAPSNSITYALTVAYPCGSNAAPYKLNTTTGAWIALNYSKNTTGAPASCTMSFTIPPDPVIGVFTSTPVTTTTVPPASTAANPSGPAPTAAVPTVVPYTTSSQTGYELYNMTTDNSESMLINGTSFTLTQNFITPSSSGVTVNGNSYTLVPGGTAQIAGQSNVYVHLVSISYLPVLHTVNYTFYQAITPAPVTTTSVTTTVPTTVTTVAPTVAPTTTAAPTPPPSAAPPSSTDYLVIGAIIVIVAVLATLLYYSRRGGRAQRRASRPAR